jgi:protease I
MGRSKARIAMIAANGFEDSELVKPLQAIREAGFKVTLIGLSEEDKRGIKGKHGTVVELDATIDEVNADDFDAIVIPGGRSPAHLRHDQRILDFVRAIDAAEKPVAAICHGPQVLASAGLLMGRTATSYHSVRQEVLEAGAEFLDQPVVVDGNLITSRKPADIPDFVQAFLASLDEAGVAGAA